MKLWLPTEHIQRQVVMTPVAAMKIPAFLLDVDRNVGRIDVRITRISTTASAYRAT